jgi:biopolymer transport protein TolR
MRRKKAISEINVVPYIDVMLVLLVIFMATAPLLTQGVKVNLPKAPSDPIEDSDQNPLVVTIREDGAIFVNVGETDFDKKETSGMRATIFSLSEQIERIFRSRPNISVYLKADASLNYGEVVNVMTVLQKAGATDVGLITEVPELAD